MKEKIEIKFIDQRLDGWEAWIGSDNKFWIRLDFLLEYYISKNVILSKKMKEHTSTQLPVKQYGEQMFNKFMDITSNGEKFSYDNYSKWLKMDNPEIQKALVLINS